MNRTIPDALAQQIAAAVCTDDNPVYALDLILTRAAGCAGMLYRTADNANTYRFDLIPDDLAAALEALTADLNAAQVLFAYLREHIGFDGREEA